MKRQTKDFDADVQETAAGLRGYWLRQTTPPVRALERARRLFREQRTGPSSDATEAQLDLIDGLIMWGELMVSVARLDPQWLAAQRREERVREAERAEWQEEVKRRERLPRPVSDEGEGGYVG